MEEYKVEPNVTMPLDLLTLLVKGTMTSGMDWQKRYAPTSIYQSEGLQFLLPETDAKLLLSKEFVLELVRKCQVTNQSESENLVSIYTHLSWGDQNVSLFLLRILIDEVKKQSNFEMALLLLDGLLKMEDDVVPNRLDFVFDFSKKYLESTPLMNYLMIQSNAKFIISVLLAVINGECDHMKVFLVANAEVSLSG